jgi:putative acetyltransferase
MPESPVPFIREETVADAVAVRRVNELAFEGTEEADIVDALRSAGAVTLSLVALAEGEVVGHIVFSPVTVETPTGVEEHVGLAPMAVRPDHQRSGIGAAMVRHGLTSLRERGHRAVVVLGHPDYYPRLGFERASRFGLRWEHECPDEAFMALELRPGALEHARGIVRYRPEVTG